MYPSELTHERLGVLSVYDAKRSHLDYPIIKMDRFAATQGYPDHRLEALTMNGDKRSCASWASRRQNLQTLHLCGSLLPGQHRRGRPDSCNQRTRFQQLLVYIHTLQPSAYSVTALQHLPDLLHLFHGYRRNDGYYDTHWLCSVDPPDDKSASQE